MKCQPGDLAWIIHDQAGDGRNLGLVVEVLRPATGCGCAGCLRYAGVSWECVTRGRPIVGTVFGIFTVETQEADIPDAWLKPIPKDGLTDEEVRELYAPGEREVSHG